MQVQTIRTVTKQKHVHTIIRERKKKKSSTSDGFLKSKLNITIELIS